jgi:hypothetical protein
MARKNLFNIIDADAGRPGFNTPGPESAQPEPLTISQPIDEADIRRRQPYREGKRAVMFFLSEEAFSQMHVLLARQGRRKVQSLMEELVDDWFRRENAPRVVK